jgi:hypothetical protein
VAPWYEQQDNDQEWIDRWENKPMCLNCQMSTKTRLKLAVTYFLMALVCMCEFVTFGKLKLCKRFAYYYSRTENKGEHR